MKVAYIRVSTEEQNEARQVTMAQEQGAEKIFVDKKSGKNTDREQFKAMMDFVREGDIVITESISRIARNTKDLLSVVGTLQDKGVEFISLKETIDTRTPTGKFMLTVFAAMAELERDTLLQRQKEGIEEAKKAGKYTGRKPIEIDEAETRKVCKKWRDGELTAVAAMKKLGLTKATFYRKVKELGI